MKVYFSGKKRAFFVSKCIVFFRAMLPLKTYPNTLVCSRCLLFSFLLLSSTAWLVFALIIVIICYSVDLGKSDLIPTNNSLFIPKQTHMLTHTRTSSSTKAVTIKKQYPVLLMFHRVAVFILSFMFVFRVAQI